MTYPIDELVYNVSDRDNLMFEAVRGRSRGVIAGLHLTYIAIVCPNAARVMVRPCCFCPD